MGLDVAHLQFFEFHFSTCTMHCKYIHLMCCDHKYYLYNACELMFYDVIQYLF